MAQQNLVLNVNNGLKYLPQRMVKLSKDLGIKDSIEHEHQTLVHHIQVLC